MDIVKGKKTYITRLRRDDIEEMKKWGEHTDPLLKGYNFPQMTKGEADYWYRKKNNYFTKRCYAVRNLEGKLVGCISLRNIKWIRRKSEMGIVFDPDNINCGYGTDSLKAFLIYYFKQMKMKQMSLKVAAFNIRAQKCYEKCGFKVTGMEFDEFEDQSLKWEVIQQQTNYAYLFRREKGIIKCLFTNMEIKSKL